MLSEEKLQKFKQTIAKSSPCPWTWGYTFGEVETDDPDIRKLGISTIPTGPRNIQLKSKGEHRFWIELTDTQLGGDVIFDFDFIVESRELVPKLIAEIERLELYLAKKRLNILLKRLFI